MLASIANAIAKVNINIENLEIEENDDTMKALKVRDLCLSQLYGLKDRKI
jgi:hypothetical protein